jgi:UDP-glucose 4-epimerase
MRVLVTGGAGYIGSVATERLLEAGHEAVVLDNFWRGHRDAVPSDVEVIDCDLRDAAGLEQALRRIKPDAVFHFAAATLVPESVERPADYFAINVVGSHHLLDAMRTAGVAKLVFSSTAAVYGMPTSLPVAEDATTAPINPYGLSKLTTEQMLEWHAAAYGLRYASLRYFNVAGATRDHGEDHRPETHAIPVALQVLLGQRPHFALYGTDYPTPDGTSIRDYVHVVDLVDAHLLALDHLDDVTGPFNLGTRDGFSVAELVAAIERVIGQPLPLQYGPRRAGDPPALTADSTRARELLRWNPTRSTLEEMIASSWDWLQRHPRGYSR